MKKILPIALTLLLVPNIVFGALATNLVSYWNLDESSGTAADSVGGNTLTNNGSAAYVSAKINNGITAVRNTDYLSHASPTGLNPTGSFSINFWVNWSAIADGNWNGMVSKCDNSSRAYCSGLLRDGSNYYIGFSIGTSGGSEYRTTQAISTPSTGVWYMYTLVFDATAHTNYIYVNAAQQVADTGAPSSAQAGTAEFRIGYHNNPSGSDGADAIFDEVSFHDRAITSGEVTTLYNAGAGCAYPFSACEVSASSIESDLILFE